MKIKRLLLIVFTSIIVPSAFMLVFVTTILINQNRSMNFFYLLVCLSVFLIVASLAGYIIVKRRVLHTLGGEPEEIEEITRKMADGDLTFELKNNGENATGVYKSAAILLESLHTMVNITDAVSKGDLTVEVTPQIRKRCDRPFF